MKKVRCPKCQGSVFFDATKYEVGEAINLQCKECAKKFRIRLTAKKPTKKVQLTEENIVAPFGYISVIENVFTEKQLIPLQEGENLIGRQSPGSDVAIQIVTGDMSMDRRHTLIYAEKNEQGDLVFTLTDNDSMTGTFLGADEILPGHYKEIEAGAVITAGATTFILYTKDTAQ